MKRTLRRSAIKRQQKKENARRLAIETISIDSVVPYAANPRVHSPSQVEAIAESIKAFGFVLPVLIDESDRILAGHGRVLAAKKLRLKSIPIIRINHLSEQQAKTYMLADNKLTERSAWDEKNSPFF